MDDSETSDIERYQAEKDQILFDKAGLGNQNDDYELSDEEVMGISDEESSDNDYYDNKNRNGKAAQREKEGWGGSRENYYGGGDDDDLESGQEDEEEEARKLQKQQVERMAEEDFYDDDDLEGWKKDADAEELIEEELNAPQDPSQISSAERFTLIQETYPEVLLLAQELENCKKISKDLDNSEFSEEVLDIKKTALGSYMGMIYAYYALFTDRLSEGVVNLKEHPVMEGILKARELWRVANNLGEDDLLESDEEVEGEVFSDIEVNGAEDEEAEIDGSEEELDEEADSQDGFDENDSEMDFDEDDEEEDVDETLDDADEFSIALPTAKKPESKKKTRTSDFDETADSVEQQARARNKQSLRFYTSEVNKRDAVKEDKFAGDLDLPYKERAFERRQRLVEQARQRGLEQRDNLGSDSEDGQDQVESNAQYAAAKEASRAKKDEKKQRHALAVAAAKEGRLQEYMEENPSVDKRAINYQIQKNRGITPKRKKENRNARVKKRVRYAAAQKKISSVRQVYKQPTSSYGGELTGIRKNLVHSTKF